MSEHLTSRERYQIWSLKESGKNKSQIAKAIKRHRSSISRELKRNKSPGGYDPEKAQLKAQKRKKTAHKRKTFTKEMQTFIKEKIEADWSPEQIEGYCKKQEISMVSDQRIYEFIRADKKQNGSLYKHLRHAKKKRKKYGASDFRGQIKDRRSIDERPEIVGRKIRFGDWEADTIIGNNHKGCALTLVERKTKIALIVNTGNKKAKSITTAIIEALNPFKDLCHTITFDNGKEFANHKEIEQKLNVKTYFAHPYSSYERGLNENTNGLIRQYIPKKTDFRNLPDYVFEDIVRNLNTRPRKTLGFASPVEAFLQMRL